MRNLLTARRAPVLRVGDLAYLDTFSGLVPCKVREFTDLRRVSRETRVIPATSAVNVIVRVTADRPGYRRGEFVESSSLWTPPRAAIRRMKYQTKVRSFWIDLGGQK